MEETKKHEWSIHEYKYHAERYGDTGSTSYGNSLLQVHALGTMGKDAKYHSMGKQCNKCGNAYHYEVICKGSKPNGASGGGGAHGKSPMRGKKPNTPNKKLQGHSVIVQKMVPLEARCSYM